MEEVIKYIDFEIARLQTVRIGVVKTNEKEMRVKGSVNVKKEATVHVKHVVEKLGRVNKSQVQAKPTLDA